MRISVFLSALIFISTVLLQATAVRALSEPTIDRISFEGNLPCSEKALLRGSGLREGVSIFMVSSRQVRDAAVFNMMNLGFLACSVQVDWPDWGEELYEVTVHVQPGRRSLRGGLSFSGDSTFAERDLAELCPVEFGDPVAPSDTAGYRRRILEEYSSLGYLRASVQINLQDFESDTSDFRELEISTASGDVCYLGSITVNGLSQVRREVVSREFDLAEGDPLNMDKMRKGLLSLYTLGLFSRVQISYHGLAEGSDTIDVQVNIVENDYKKVELAGGYIAPEALLGSVWWTQPNIMGNNQSLKMGGIYVRYIDSDNSGNEYMPMIIYEEPWFLSTRWSSQLKLGYYHLQQDFQEVRSYGGELGFSREFRDVWKFNCSYSIDRLRFRAMIDDSVELVQDWITSAGISSGITRDTRIPLLNPVRGKWYKLAGSLAGGIAGGDIDYYTVDGEFRSFFRLNNRLVLAGRAAGSIAHGYGDNQVVPPNDRLYLGGGSTVRGYDFQTLGPEDENGDPLGGNFMLLGNLEARLKIRGSLGAALFCDAGGVWSSLDDISTEDTGLGTGLGIRYDTPIGPVRLDYGVAPTWSNFLKRGKVYFAIGQAF